jgi:hypothetical protein
MYISDDEDLKICPSLFLYSGELEFNPSNSMRLYSSEKPSSFHGVAGA